MVCQDMAPLAEWQTLDPSNEQKAVKVMVPTEGHVNGEAYFAMIALPAVDPENLSIMTRRHTLVDNELEQLVVPASEYSARHCQWDGMPSSWSCSAAWSSGGGPRMTWEPHELPGHPDPHEVERTEDESTIRWRRKRQASPGSLALDEGGTLRAT